MVSPFVSAAPVAAGMCLLFGVEGVKAAVASRFLFAFERLLLLVDGFSLANRGFRFLQGQCAVRLQFLGECSVPDADNKSVSDHLLFQPSIVAIVDEIIEGYNILLCRLPRSAGFGG